MEKDVLITVSGLLFTGNGDDEKDYIDVISPGQYYRKNGKSYLFYEEIAEGFSEPIRNVIKISPEEVVLKKNGVVTAEMNFQLKKSTSSHYSTPFGTLALGIRTSRIHMQESEEEMKLNIEYGLEINYEHVSDCFIRVLVQPQKENGGFSLTS